MSEHFADAGKKESAKLRETHIDCTESFGAAYTSLSIETNLTYDELIALVRELRGDAE